MPFKTFFLLILCVFFFFRSFLCHYYRVIVFLFVMVNNFKERKIITLYNQMCHLRMTSNITEAIHLLHSSSHLFFSSSFSIHSASDTKNNNNKRKVLNKVLPFEKKLIYLLLDTLELGKNARFTNDAFGLMRLVQITWEIRISFQIVGNG